LSWDELVDMTPAELYRLQLVNNRERERDWEIGREIIAACLNPHTKQKVKGRDIIKLSFDDEVTKIEWDDQLVRKILRTWN